MDWNAVLVPFVCAGAVILGLLFALVLLWLIDRGPGKAGRTQEGAPVRHDAKRPITTPWDTRLPQAYEWDDLLPALVSARLWQLLQERNVCPDPRVPAIDAALIALLVPYRRDRR